jgi:hypothetical protein
MGPISSIGRLQIRQARSHHAGILGVAITTPRERNQNAVPHASTVLRPHLGGVVRTRPMGVTRGSGTRAPPLAGFRQDGSADDMGHGF